MAQFDKKLFRLNGTNASVVSTGVATATLNAYVGVITITADTGGNTLTLTNSKVGANSRVIASLSCTGAAVPLTARVSADNTVIFTNTTHNLGAAADIISFIILNPDT